MAEFQQVSSPLPSPTGLSPPQEEKTLLEFRQRAGLTDEQMMDLIEAELKESGAARRGGARLSRALDCNRRRGRTGRIHALTGRDFMRMLRLSGLDGDAMTDDQRDAFINMAENLGIEPDEAEDMVDLYLEEIEAGASPGRRQSRAPDRSQRSRRQSPAATRPVADARQPCIDPDAERARYANFVNHDRREMLLVPSGDFKMGSEAARCRA